MICYEYTYDLLGRVEQSVERPRGDTTVYTYTPSGWLHTEERTGQVAYSRSYEYNLDGSRRSVYRVDSLNGEHHEMYGYDPVSGRLSTVTDTVPEPDVVHSFVWNPEGTLARWSEPNTGYDRVFGYDEEGRLVQIERDYGNGNKQVAYEYGYNTDGVKVWKKDHLNQQEYRYLCRIGCGGTPMRVYNRAMGHASWTSAEDYMKTPTFIAYHNTVGSYFDYRWLAGNWLATFAGEYRGRLVYRDAFGATPIVVELDFPPPLYLTDDEGTGTGDFHPQALMVLIIAGLLLIGLVLWFSLCLLSAIRGAEEAENRLDLGNDKFKHCVAGCLVTRCFDDPPFGIGVAWELFQGITTGWDHDWRIDAIATEFGVAIGVHCLGHFGPIGGFFGGFQGCCEKTCQRFWGTGGIFR